MSMRRGGWRDLPFPGRPRHATEGLTWPTALAAPGCVAAWSNESAVRLAVQLQRPSAKGWLLLDLRTRERLIDAVGVGAPRRQLELTLRRLADDRDHFDLTRPLARYSVRPIFDDDDAATWTEFQTMALASGASWSVPVPLIASRIEVERLRRAIARRRRFAG